MYIVSDRHRNLMPVAAPPSVFWTNLHALASAVLDQAIRDLTSPEPTLAREAREWLFREPDPMNENPYAEGWFVCDLLGISPTALYAYVTKKGYAHTHRYRAGVRAKNPDANRRAYVDRSNR